MNEPVQIPAANIPSVQQAGVKDTQSAASSSQKPAVLASPQNISKSSLLDILVQEGVINQDQAKQLGQDQVSTGKDLESLLKSKQLASEEDFVRAKAKLNNIPYLKIADTGVSPEAIDKIDESIALRYKILPFAIDKSKNELSVAMEDPLDLMAINFVEQKTSFKLIPHYATKSELDRAIAERYSQDLSSDVTQALAESTQVAEQKQQQADLSSLASSVMRDAPINRIVDTVLEYAMRAEASDVHIEPQEERTRVRYRIDGILVEKLILPKTVHSAVVSRVKILADLKIDEKRIPQDGRFTYSSTALAKEVDLRVSTCPSVHGEKVVMRLLKKGGDVPELEGLGMSGMALLNVKQAISVPHGISLVTGPTGSGKTTTLYSILNIINTPKVNIMTLEDPVEYEMKGITQVQTNPKAGLTFASGLRSFLRQDPDIIMVGEIRDSETAELAIQASLTGHLVFSTLHTSSAAGAIPRMLDMGAEPFLLASTVTMVMAQRVVRRLNESYKEEYKPEPQIIEDIKNVLGPHFDYWLKQKNKTVDQVTLFRPVAERPHNEPEYRGRIGIFEVLMVTEEVSRLILERRPASDLEQSGIKNGMLLMKQDGYIKALEGITTIEEVLRVAEI
ncbi:MAG: ATPase, T2SS/T4P/T4SS family [Candidatus Woesebacteria bacterium]|jgi:type IV pilus assembly protein PilB